MKTNNKATLDKGFAKGLTIIRQYMIVSLTEICMKCLAKVAENREFQGWSGNTQTSYMGGIYVGGRLVKIVNQENWHRPALRRKLRKGEWGHLKDPYEGSARSVQGKVETNGGLGVNTSRKFLSSYTRCPKNGFAMVITTGTEYSEYLEQALDLDVLTKTYIDAPPILMTGFKPME